MDWTLMVLIGIFGLLSTYGMIRILWYLHDKENK